MVKELRTSRGKLIGTLDERTGILTIKDGKKLTHIKIPPTGLSLSHTSGDGVTEDVYIAPCSRTNAA